MKHKLLAALGVVVFGLAMFAATPATATSTGVAGPYYATPSWDQTLPANTRFIVLSNMGGQGVLDRETGLIWAQSPDSTLRTWQAAMDYCTTLSLGGRLGWRLPTIAELESLVDPSQTNPPMLPSGHPFNNVHSGWYWSSSTSSGDSSVAWVVYMLGGNVLPSDKTGSGGYVWPVRGGGGQ